MGAGERFSGRIAFWNDEAGYGFIESSALRRRLFVHIKDIRGGASRPVVGDEIVFALGVARDGRPAATAAVISGPQWVRGAREYEGTPARFGLRLAAATILVILLVAGVMFRRIDLIWPIIYLAMGFATAVAYVTDKVAAERGAWRIPEKYLHALDLAFGIVGGLLAQVVLHHKTSKQAFGIVTALIYAAHLAGMVVLVSGVRLVR